MHLDADGVRRSELRNSGALAGDPAQDVHLFGISQTVSYRIGNHFEQSMSAEILVIVDVGLHFHANHAVDFLRVFLMERELDIRFAELDLLVTRGGIGMEESWTRFRREFPLQRRPAYLIDHGPIRIAKKAVLGQRLVPEYLLEVIERGLRR